MSRINVEMDFPKLPKENGKGKLKIWGCNFFGCRNVEMERPFLHFYIHMGTTPNFGRYFLKLRRIVEVKKLATFFWEVPH